jgi:hypothetical protein
MSTRRERWYHCTFESKKHQVTAAVHAWNAAAAVEQFEAAVRDVTDDPGTVRVEPGLGTLLSPGGAVPLERPKPLRPEWLCGLRRP